MVSNLPRVVIVIILYTVLSNKSTYYEGGNSTPFANAAVVSDTHAEGKENVHDASQHVNDSLRDLVSALADLGKAVLQIVVFVVRILWFPFHLLWIVLSFIGRLVWIILRPILRFVWWLCTPLHAIILDIVHIVTSVVELVANFFVLLWAMVMSAPPAVHASIVVVLWLMVAFNFKRIALGSMFVFNSVWQNISWALNLLRDVISGLTEVAILHFRRPSDVTQAEIEVRLASIWHHLRNARPPLAAGYGRNSGQSYGSTGPPRHVPVTPSRGSMANASSGATMAINETTTSTEQSAECSICLIDLNAPGKRVLALTRCGHVFHEECIRRWLSTNNSCPIDRIRAEETS